MSDAAPQPVPPPVPLEVPALSLVLLIGPTGSGKSTFAARHFAPTEVVSSDRCRELISDDENDQSVSAAAFELLRLIARRRLERGRLTVVDATNLEEGSRQELRKLAKDVYCPAVAIVLALPKRTLLDRNAGRTDRDFGEDVVREHARCFNDQRVKIEKERYRRLHVLDSAEAIQAATIVRVPSPADHRTESGPFDIIGDVHGCLSELLSLLGKLGWEVDADAGTATPPDNRRAMFVGDLGDRGPDTPGVIRLVIQLVERGRALCVAGNHDDKLRRYLGGSNVRVSHGLERTIEQFDHVDDAFRARTLRFVRGLPHHMVLDGGALVVAHAGLKHAMHGRDTGAVRSFCYYGETTGATDSYGLPVRVKWAETYGGAAKVVYGHTPVRDAEWLNGTINIDTGCVFGGRLTALRYPELELVSVPAECEWYEPAKPLE